MRYFTKEWYNDTMVADMCFQLRKTERASVLSDTFFEKLYAVEERAYLKFAKRAAKSSHAYFDKDATRKEFADNYRENLEFVKKNLPEDILCDVKDIRVLALGSATHDIAMRITRFCGKKNRQCESIERSYENDSEAADEALGSHANALLSLNGSQISSLSHCENGDILLSYSSNGESTASLRLKNTELTEGAENIEGMAVVRHEVLLSEKGFEFSLLLLSDDSSLHTVAYIASEIIGQ